jgi:hypothetical protein
MTDLFAAEDLFEASGRYGYLHPGYAESYVEAGEVRHLRRSGAWMLTRDIPGSERRDALVGHPLLVCRDWSALPGDLAETAALANVVTVSAVTDPLAPVREETLRESFPDLVRVGAQHFVADLLTFWPSRDHRRAVRRAMDLVEIDIEDAPRARLDDWERIGGFVGPVGPADPRLSREALTRQLGLPGCVGITALDEDGPVAMAIAYVSGEGAHIHALASSERGDELGAPYAVVQAAVEDMVGRGLRLLDLGSANATDAPAAEELSRFMSGWTELTRPSYLCGRIADRIAYDALAADAGSTGSASFPAYRDPSARLGADTGGATHSGGGGGNA